MAANYPSSAPSFSVKATNDVIEASHVNSLQEEVTAIGSALITSLQHNLIFTDNTYDIGASGATRPRNIFLAGTGSTAPGFTAAGSGYLTSYDGSTSFRTRMGASAALGAFFDTNIGTDGNSTINTDAVRMVGISGTPLKIQVSPATAIGAARTFTDVAAISGAAKLSLYIGTGDGIHQEWDSSDVAHGMTTLAATTVYALMRKAHATEGGLSLQGYSSGVAGAKIHGLVGAVDTTEAGSSNGAIQLIGELANGTGTQVLGADDNLVVFKNGVNATHIFKGNGDAYNDGADWVAYDEHDDIALLQALEHELTKEREGAVPLGRAEEMKDCAAVLHDLKLLRCDPQFPGQVFVNRAMLQNLMCGAIRQLADEMEKLKKEKA